MQVSSFCVNFVACKKNPGQETDATKTWKIMKTDQLPNLGPAQGGAVLLRRQNTWELPPTRRRWDSRAYSAGGCIKAKISIESIGERASRMTWWWVIMGDASENSNMCFSFGDGVNWKPSSVMISWYWYQEFFWNDKVLFASGNLRKPTVTASQSDQSVSCRCRWTISARMPCTPCSWSADAKGRKSVERALKALCFLKDLEFQIPKVWPKDLMKPIDILWPGGYNTVAWS